MFTPAQQVQKRHSDGMAAGADFTVRSPREKCTFTMRPKWELSVRVSPDGEVAARLSMEYRDRWLIGGRDSVKNVVHVRDIRTLVWIRMSSR